MIEETLRERSPILSGCLWPFPRAGKPPTDPALLALQFPDNAEQSVNNIHFWRGVSPTMGYAPNEQIALKIVRVPKVQLVGWSIMDRGEIDRFLSDHGHSWETDTEVGGEQLSEAAGRLCYMSFGKGRKTNHEYLDHILQVGHGSVLEHSVWNFIISNVSRSFTHELIRHRAGFGYSQLSQRYVDETDASFVEPDCIAEDAELHRIWTNAISSAQTAYCQLVEKLAEKYAEYPDKTMRRKLARQAARSVLPNACETKIFVTANARALRHFIELRGTAEADVEIRAVAVALLRILCERAPNLFGDYTISRHTDGTEVISTPYRKV
jgi:thymidylate synthase (FAD)